MNSQVFFWQIHGQHLSNFCYYRGTLVAIMDEDISLNSGQSNTDAEITVATSKEPDKFSDDGLFGAKPCPYKQKPTKYKDENDDESEYDSKIFPNRPYSFDNDVLCVYDSEKNFDYEKAQKIMKRFSDRKLKVIDYAKSLQPGWTKVEAVRSLMESCKYTCFVVTRNFFSSLWLKFKADMAIQAMLECKGKQYTVIVIVMDDMEAEDLPLEFQTLSPIFEKERYFENRLQNACKDFSICKPKKRKQRHKCKERKFSTLPSTSSMAQGVDNACKFNAKSKKDTSIKNHRISHGNNCLLATSQKASNSSSSQQIQVFADVHMPSHLPDRYKSQKQSVNAIQQQQFNNSGSRSLASVLPNKQIAWDEETNEQDVDDVTGNSSQEISHIPIGSQIQPLSRLKVPNAILQDVARNQNFASNHTDLDIGSFLSVHDTTVHNPEVNLPKTLQPSVAGTNRISSQLTERKQPVEHTFGEEEGSSLDSGVVISCHSSRPDVDEEITDEQNTHSAPRRSSNGMSLTNANFLSSAINGNPELTSAERIRFSSPSSISGQGCSVIGFPKETKTETLKQSTEPSDLLQRQCIEHSISTDFGIESNSSSLSHFSEGSNASVPRQISSQPVSGYGSVSTWHSSGEESSILSTVKDKLLKLTQNFGLSKRD
ncbi:uncharacterized protein LOC143451541 isoform X2 [Clavelina lepadiformis]|uniref:uncharacterized protein LOC143451541 isoform X2 n=1 Tax=Clavelina lepadiformis TaxID=159417 RepID=UPI0040429206